jgi:hypothetical protein
VDQIVGNQIASHHSLAIFGACHFWLAESLPAEAVSFLEAKLSQGGMLKGECS